jgi:methyl-accepting chemotaxis protein
MPAQGGSDGRVTLAVLSAQITRLQHDVDELARAVARLADEMSRSNAGASALAVRMDTAESEIDRLRASSSAWSLINSIAAVIAGILGGLGIQR